MSQTLTSFRFEVVRAGNDELKLRIFLLPFERGIVGKITLGEIAELIRYLEGTSDKMMREKKHEENKEKGEKLS